MANEEQGTGTRVDTPSASIDSRTAAVNETKSATSIPNQARAVLLKAAAIVERGWCQGAAVDIDGSRCLVGAFCLASDGAALDVSCAASRALERVIGTVYCSQWNDAPERTQAEVVAALRHAADLALEAH
jgi:hypothetical protein